MIVDDSENEVIEKIVAETTKTQHPLSLLQQAIANMPDIDQQKVQAALNKIAEGKLEALGNAQERMNCAQRIAQSIMTELTNFSEDNSQ